MKHLSIAVIFFLSIVGVANARPIGGSDSSFNGSQEFKHDFPQATYVTYKVRGQMTEVSFVWNNLHLQAFYDEQGQLMATCRPVEVSNVPVAAQLALKSAYPNGIVRDAIEFNDPNDGVSYYTTVIDPKATYVLHVSTGGTISVFKKMKN
jgi:hypothetical protein